MDKEQHRPLRAVAAALAIDGERHVALLDRVVGALDRGREASGIETAIGH